MFGGESLRAAMASWNASRILQISFRRDYISPRLQNFAAEGLSHNVGFQVFGFEFRCQS